MTSPSERSERVKRVVMWIAGRIDDALIWFYVRRGNADTPCGRVQAWARDTRAGDAYETTMKAKETLDT